MTSLGSFGTPRDALDINFDYFGTMVRVNPDLSGVSLIDFMREATGLDQGDPDIKAVVGAADSMLHYIVHPDDFDAFWAVAKSQRQTLEDLTDLMQQLIEAVTEVPTERPSTSSDGPLSTEPSSSDVSSLPDIARFEAAGRPDLALLKRREQEFLSA